MMLSMCCWLYRDESSANSTESDDRGADGVIDSCDGVMAGGGALDAVMVRTGERAR